MRRTQLAMTLATTMLAAFTVSGCDTWSNAVAYVRSDSEAVCPDANVLANTAVLPVFDPAKGADPANVVYTVRMTGVKSRCDYSKRTGNIDNYVRVQYVATRAPGGEAVHYRVPYYVAVTSGGEIVDKKNFWLEFDFPKAEASVRGEVIVDEVDFTTARDKRSFEYHLLTGFQLTQSQIEYNKKMGQYLP